MLCAGNLVDIFFRNNKKFNLYNETTQTQSAIHTSINCILYINKTKIMKN